MAPGSPRKGTAAAPTGFRAILPLDRQRDWIHGRIDLQDAEERNQSLERRFKYAARFEKLLRRSQAQEVLELLGIYGRDCLPMPRRTERVWWSVSCLPSTGDKPLVRVNASWMEFFTLYADGDSLRARFILHLSDFTTDRSVDPERLDEAVLESCVEDPGTVDWTFPSGKDIFIVKASGGGAVRALLAGTRMLRAIRTFNLTHMNRGRNAYQASHCYSLADCMVGE